MRIIKKILLFMVMLFAFTSCGLLDILDSGPQVSTVNSARSFTRAQKRIAVVNGPDYVRRKVSDQLSNRGWKVSGALTGKETFAIYFDTLDSATQKNHYVTTDYSPYGNQRTEIDETKHITYGYVSIYDLRTQKRLYVYDFEDESEDKIIKGIMAAVTKLEESMR